MVNEKGYEMMKKSYRDDIELLTLAGRKIGIKHSVWSVRDITSDYILRRNIPMRFRKNKLVYRVHWGQDPVEADMTGVVSWADLWLLADRLVGESGDRHHSFIEVFKVKGDNLEMETGS